MKILIKQIRVGKRARKEFPHLQSVMKSIEDVGLINPLLVHSDGDGFYTLLAGECRLKAVVLLGWVDVDCTTREQLSPIMKLSIELEENIRRKQLEWTERVDLVRQLDEAQRDIHGHGSKDFPKGHNVDKLAVLTGLSRTQAALQVGFAKKLLDRPDVKEKVKDLPMHAAVKRFDQIVAAEDMERQQKEGVIRVVKDLRLGDCLELIKGIDGGTVDCVVTDPPFGISGLEENSSKASSTSRPVSYRMMLDKEDNLDLDGVEHLMGRLIPQLARVMVRGGHLYMFFCHDMYGSLRVLLEMEGFLVSPVPLIWDKMRTTHPFNGYGYPASYEPILFAQLGEKSRRLTECQRDILSYKPVESGDKIHPFEKPLALLTRLITQSTYKGQVVLDPFAGSGSTLVAARMCGRSCIGFESGEEHFRLAQKRLMEI